MKGQRVMKTKLLTVLIIIFTLLNGQIKENQNSDYYRYVNWKSKLDQAELELEARKQYVFNAWGISLGWVLIVDYLTKIDPLVNKISNYSSVAGCGWLISGTYENKNKTLSKINNLKNEGQKHNWLNHPPQLIQNSNASSEKINFDIETELIKLKKLYKNKLITEEEYKKLRSELLLKYSGTN